MAGLCPQALIHLAYLILIIYQTLIQYLPPPPTIAPKGPLVRPDLPKEVRSAGISKRRGYKPSAIVQSQNRRAEEAELTQLNSSKSACAKKKSQKSKKRDVSQLIDAFEPLMSPSRCER